MKRLAYSTWFVSVTLGLLACGDGDAPLPIQNRIALRSFDSCAELEQYIEDTAVEQMARTLDGYEDGYYFFDLAAGGAPEARANADSSQSSGPTAYTKTNTQVEGVDEADFVKTDGRHIYVLSGQKLYAVTSWPAANMTLSGSLELEGWPQDMFLLDDGRVVIFSYVYTQAQESYCDAYYGYYCGGEPSTKVSVVDASDLSNLVVSEEIFIPGWYSSSRLIDSSVRIVLWDQIRMPNGVRMYPDFSGDWEKDRAGLLRSIEQLKAQNAQLIRARTLDDWLPEMTHRRTNGQTYAVARDCTSYHRSNAPVRLGLATIATLNLAQGGASLHHTTVLGEVGHVYASMQSLYIATPHWWWWPRAGQVTYTYLHKFDISSPSHAVYVASGGVDGYPLNQFSMDEHQGFMRLATTIDTRVPDLSNPWGRIETTNRITVLGEYSGQLVEVGRTADIAQGERIQSARFIGDKGFVVTFRQVDPLFTVDLANPASPHIVGELKVPGFSSYIHPLDDNHLLTIGVDLPEPDSSGRVDWSQRSMKLTIFDVSDFAHPVEKFTRLVGTANGWSEAGWNHKAFNYFPERQMLAIPFADYNPSAADYWGSFVSDLRLFHIDTQAGITARGAITMTDVYLSFEDNQWSWRWSPWVRRSVMADDFAYAISDAGIRVANMSAPAQPVATVLFDAATQQAR